MRVTIHQPEHLPWLGFFHKISQADIFVVLDNVQYRRRYFQNRNKIRTKDGWQWVIVPLEKENRDDLLIKDAKIFQDNSKWKKSNLESIRQNYSRAANFKYYWDNFSALYSKDYTFLIDLNMELLKFFFTKIGIRTEIKMASDLKVSGEKGDLIYNICKSLGTNTYISGISGKDYLDIKKFNDNGIEVVIQDFHHPIYKQLYFPFIPCMSVIDLLFNYGQESLKVINGVGMPVIEDICL